MIALHVSIIAGDLFLWGEDAAVQARQPAPRGGPAARTMDAARTADAARSADARGAGGGAAAWHPRGARPKRIAEALRRIGASAGLEGRNVRDRIVWLPSRGGVPLASSPALGVQAPPAGAAAHAALRPFRVTAVPLDAAELLDPALREANEALFGSDVLLGPSIALCTRVVELALHAAQLQEYLPGLERRAGAWAARWQPCLGDALQLELQALAAAMPAACRCMSADASAAPRQAARAVAGELLASALDALLRRGGGAGPASRRDRRPRAFDSVHDAWLAALTEGDGRLAWPRATDLETLRDTLQRWTRAARLLAEAPFTLCFRLTEPRRSAHGEGRWRVDFLLQPKADPSLQFPLESALDPGGDASEHLLAFGGNCMEFALTALGQAAGICPAAAQSLARSDLGGFDLDTDGAWQFLTEQAGVLAGAGYPVLLPSWWTGHGPARKVAAYVTVSSGRARGPGMGLDAIVSFDVAASLGGERLSLAELRALARIKAPLVQVRGEWVHVDPDQIEAALRAMKGGEQGTMTARDALALALGGAGEVAGLPVGTVRLEGWLDELAASLTRREELAVLPQPDGFAGTLRPYQVRGFSWLAFLRTWGLGACLADDMGLGKTIQALALLLRERLAGETRPALLICPTSVIGNWRHEAAHFTPSLPILVHHGVDRRRRAAFAEEARRHALVVSSYGLLQRDADFLRELEWSGLILDEAQNIKNPETKQSRAARAIRADYRIALTGTPVENHVGDLWSIMDVLNPGLLGTRAAFTAIYQRPIHLFGDEEQAARLRAITGPFVLRRMKTDRNVISDLPEKIETKEYCTLTREQASLYQAVLDELQKDIAPAEGIQRRGMVLAALTKLKQVCNHPAHFLKDGSPLHGRSGKLARLEELLRDIREAGERALVFTQYAEMGEALQRHLRARFGEDVLFLHGGVPRARRDAMVKRWQDDGDAPRVFVLSLKAGGLGLNLTRANHVLHYDRWWNPAVEDQATDRAFRIGQQRNVMVHRFIVTGTLEEHIDDLIERKSDVARRVVGSGEQWLTELSNRDLFSLLRLGADAVGEDGNGKT